MPKIRSLSEAIRYQIAEIVPPIEPSMANPMAGHLGQQLPFTNITDPEEGVFRWGFSAWGLAPITTKAFPDS